MNNKGAGARFRSVVNRYAGLWTVKCVCNYNVCIIIFYVDKNWNNCIRLYYISKKQGIPSYSFPLFLCIPVIRKQFPSYHKSNDDSHGFKGLEYRNDNKIDFVSTRLRS